MEYNIKDAFKELDILNEAEEFNLTRDWDVDKLHDILNGDIEDDILNVIDPGLADDQSTLVDGDCVVCCEVCNSNIFKHPEELVLDPETELYNIEEECPYCHQIGGFKKIGIFKACAEGECEEAPTSEDPTEEVKIEEKGAEDIKPLDESINENKAKETLTEAKFTKDSILAAARRILNKKQGSSLEESTDEDTHMSPADIAGLKKRAEANMDESLEEDDEKWCDRLDKMTNAKQITEAEAESAVIDEPSDEVDLDNPLEELHDESSLAYTYYNFIPEDLYNDVKSGVADISQISLEALNAILDRGDFTEDQKKYLLDMRQSAVNDKFDDFADNWEDRVK